MRSELEALQYDQKKKSQKQPSQEKKKSFKIRTHFNKNKSSRSLFRVGIMSYCSRETRTRDLDTGSVFCLLDVLQQFF